MFILKLRISHKIPKLFPSPNNLALEFHIPSPPKSINPKNNNGFSEFIELLSPPLNKNKPEQPTEPIFITYSRKSQHHLATIKAQNSSSTPPEQQPTESTNETATTPIGFGSVSTSSPAKKQKGKKERSRIIRREPVEAPKFVTQQKEQRASDEQQGSNERLGSLIFVEGIALAASGIVEKGSSEIVCKAMGIAIDKTVTIVELIKRRIVGLHQITSIGSTDITDTWEALEEGLLPLETTRHVSMITITLSKAELNTSSIGYQPPLPDDQVKVSTEFEYIPLGKRDSSVERLKTPNICTWLCPKKVFCQFDWDMDELEEFTNERIFADELSEDQRDGFKEFAREKVRERRRANFVR
ncbi:putative DNA/RNA-binding protein Alba [Helianthus annuus]|uniref:DNA/RNA-binding protein Alba n=2 Tax=Helianthus annuus TaxID=4232 RepID=A0A9K3IJK2_HELAN|nr:putative DNA/RNA-binding protein Alba [Helianthus annuus]